MGETFLVLLVGGAFAILAEVFPLAFGRREPSGPGSAIREDVPLRPFFRVLSGIVAVALAGSLLSLVVFSWREIGRPAWYLFVLVATACLLILGLFGGLAWTGAPFAFRKRGKQARDLSKKA